MTLGPTKVLAGPGIHSGAPCRLEIRRRTADATPGIRFFIGGRMLAPRDLAGLPRSARRATGLGTGDLSLRTPEHLLAALLFFRREPLDIRCEGGEIPNLDGSALPFRDALSGLIPSTLIRPGQTGSGHSRSGLNLSAPEDPAGTNGRKGSEGPENPADPADPAGLAAPTTAWEEYPSDLEWEHAWTGGHIRTRPAKRFAATWILDRDGLSETVRVESAAEVWDKVLPARTWIFHREWVRGREAGLLQGGRPDAGLLLAESPGEHAALRAAHPEWAGGAHPLLNQPEWRMDREPVQHKVLDLLGDLALADLRLPALEIEVRNGGHACNHLLLERLIHG